jgi:hypothetical protein
LLPLEPPALVLIFHPILIHPSFSLWCSNTY